MKRRLIRVDYRFVTDTALLFHSFRGCADNFRMSFLLIRRGRISAVAATAALLGMDGLEEIRLHLEALPSFPGPGNRCRSTLTFFVDSLRRRFDQRPELR
jgi:hypothetical protein